MKEFPLEHKPLRSLSEAAATRADVLHAAVFGSHQHPCPSEHCRGTLRRCSDPYCQPGSKLCSACVAVAELDHCEFCGKPEGLGPDGLVVRDCTDDCGRLVCANCAEVDYDFVGDPGQFVCCQWACPKCCGREAVAS